MAFPNQILKQEEDIVSQQPRQRNPQGKHLVLFPAMNLCLPGWIWEKR